MISLSISDHLWLLRPTKHNFLWDSRLIVLLLLSLNNRYLLFRHLSPFSVISHRSDKVRQCGQWRESASLYLITFVCQLDLLSESAQMRTESVDRFQESWKWSLIFDLRSPITCARFSSLDCPIDNVHQLDCISHCWSVGLSFARSCKSNERQTSERWRNTCKKPEQRHTVSIVSQWALSVNCSNYSDSRWQIINHGLKMGNRWAALA